MFEQGTICEWNPRIGGAGKLRVKVCGVATNGVPILGKTLIVELLEQVAGYPYTCAAAFERDLTPAA